MGELRRLTLGIVASVAAATVPAKADDLIMPFACQMTGGVPRLTASGANAYHIFGPREDQTFSTCAPGPSTSCETMMVHKFTIECAGQRVAWSKVAASARAAGVDMPEHLPAGFAPISRLAGRFVLPGLVRSTPAITRVAMQDLSPDSVIEPAPVRRRAENAAWVTVVDSEVQAAATGQALKVAGVVSTLLMTLMTASLVIARRRNLPAFDFASLPEAASALVSRAGHIVSSAIARTRAAFRHSYESWQAASDSSGGDGNVARALALVHARLTETEFLVATLPANLLLRDVLQSELDGLRERGAEVARRLRDLGPQRAGANLRALLRDLDRITRIVHGASPQYATNAEQADQSHAPASVFEAYRILGLNPEAPPAAVKKVVDALRMSWHPDHARDEADRVYRERRIKQINAAWDLLKNTRSAAA